MKAHVVDIGKRVCGSPERLEEWDLEKLESLGIQEIWYHYETGSYEGYGYLLARIEDKYELFDLSHCSCEGPIDYIRSFKGSSPEDLIERCSKELLTDVTELFKAARLKD